MFPEPVQYLTHSPTFVAAFGGVGFGPPRPMLPPVPAFRRPPGASSIEDYQLLFHVSVNALPALFNDDGVARS